MYHRVNDSCTLSALIHILGLINMQCQFFESQWVLPRKIVCSADVKCKCNRAQVRNRS